MISERRLKRLLLSLAGSPQRGTFFRSIDLQWLLHGAPLSAVASRLRGGRYNRRGDFEALYVADTQETALYETEAIFKTASLVVGVRQAPRVMLSLDCDLHHVIELHDPSVLKSLDLTIDDLRRPWKLQQAENRPVLTQRIGSGAESCSA